MVRMDTINLISDAMKNVEKTDELILKHKKENSAVSLIDGHIDNGMSDEDIIKILKYCEGKDGISYCNNCPLYEYDNCVHFMSQMAREFINRKNADIENLKHNLKCAKDHKEGLIELSKNQRKEIENLNIELKAMRGAANSYKAEVEKNKIRIRDLTNYQVADVETRKKVVAKAKSEAIKEFAERLKIFVIPQKADGYTREIVLKSNIDNLVKEMTESK